jgi:hypothetical protein
MTNPLVPEWHVRACATACAGCRRPFADGEKVLTRLLAAEGGWGYLREDRCAECAKKTPVDGPGVLSAWRAAYVAPERKVEPVAHETAEGLFRDLLSADDPAKRPVVFILAVLLERRKVLVEKSVSEEEGTGGKIRVYAHRKTGEAFWLRDPGLKDDDLPAIQAEVESLLGIARPAAAGNAAAATGGAGDGERKEAGK